MEQNVKQLFLQTLSPNESIRNGAESRLKELETNEEFINYTRNVLMKASNDKNIQHISSIYFMNTIIKNWKIPEMARIVNDLSTNILGLLKTDEKPVKNAYLKILNYILEGTNKVEFENLFNASQAYLESIDYTDNKVAFVLYEEAFKNDNLGFSNDTWLLIVFNKFGDLFSQRFSEYLNKREYGLAAMALKILSKAYSQHTLPDYLNSVDVYRNYLNVSIYIMCLESHSGESFLKMQRWATYFVYKTVNKGLKKYFIGSVLVGFIRDNNILSSVYAAFTTLLNNYIKNHKYHPKVPIICADFFGVFASNKHTRDFVKSNYAFLINNFILPSQAYNEDLKERFECYEDDYLRARYNYNGSELRTSTAELFEDIIGVDKAIEAEIIQNLQIMLIQNSGDEGSCLRYGIIGLLANIQKNLLSLLKQDEYNNFVKKHIFEELGPQNLFMASQALYFLSLSESIEISDSSLIAVLNIIVGMIDGDNNILAVEACLALNVFFFNVSLKNSFKPIIAKIFEKVLVFSKTYFLESLSSLMDSIIDCFTDEITMYAPTFINSLCTTFLESIDASEKDANMFSALSGTLTTIEKMIITASDKPEIVQMIYKSTSKVVFFIFKNQKTDYYQEGFDIMNSFLFVLQTINESMFEIFNLILSIDKDELSVYPREIGDLIDNYISYGKVIIVTPYILGSIMIIIDLFMPAYDDSTDIYDEDYETACRIIDSLMLNAGAKVNTLNPNFIPIVVGRIVANFDYISDYSTLKVFSIESIMNCYIVSPESTFLVMGAFIPTFFDEIVQLKAKFQRVYDKKLFILFFGTFFKYPESISLNYPLIVDTFIDVLSSLPEAITKRNKLKQDAESEVQDENEDDYSDYTANSLPEDIYFETILDDFDAFSFVVDRLANVISKSFGSAFVSHMTAAQVAKIMSILDIYKK